VLGGRRQRGGQDAVGLYELAVVGGCCGADGRWPRRRADHLHPGPGVAGKQLAAPGGAQHIADVFFAARTLHLASLSACWRSPPGWTRAPT
jgi:hypothetical protein